METKKTVGVFPCGSEVGLEVGRSLRYSRILQLVGLSSIDDHGRVAYGDYVGSLPMVTDLNFVDRLAEVIGEKKIDFLVPAMDSVAVLLKENEEALGCEVVSSPAATVRILASKSDTYRALGTEVLCNRVYSDYDEARDHLPVFMKPDRGYGSRGARLIETVKDLDYEWRSREGRLFLEYLPGAEFTVDCFSRMSHELVFCRARRRKRVRMGISVNTELSDLSGIQSMAEKISLRLGLQGGWFFQVKLDKNDNLVLMEVASRIAGSMAVHRINGINLVLMDIYQRLGNRIDFFNGFEDGRELERSFDCRAVVELDCNVVYVDFDDCLIIDGQVNTTLIQFLWQSLNLGRRLVLVTRHGGNLQERLEQHRLDRLFDEVIWLRNGEKKSDVIGEDAAIFIDDSFAERREVSDRLGIPVFAPDAVPMLIDARRF